METIGAIQAVATGNIITFQPAEGMDSHIKIVGSDVWTAAGAPNNVPRVNVGITNGVLTALLARSGDIAGWLDDMNIKINNALFLSLENPAAGGNENLAYQGVNQRQWGNFPSTVVSGVQSVLTGGTFLIRPPVGEDQIVRRFASDLWVGAQPNAMPDITVELTDGVIFAPLLSGANFLRNHTPLEIHINNNVYLRVTNNNALTASIGWIAEKMSVYGSSPSRVMSQVATLGIGGSLDARPTNVLEQWKVSMICAPMVGVAPNAYPDVDVFLNNGVIQSLIAQNSDLAYWNGHQPDIPVHNGQYLTITDTSGAGGAVGFSALNMKYPAS